MTVAASWVGELRGQELACLLQHSPACGRVLDFGAGTGQQALRLQQLGFEVHAVDIDSSPYREQRVFAVTSYDGAALPFPDAHFDVVMSSNVLEHVPDLPATLQELARVLKPGGVMLHVLPSSSWRLWSTLAEFPAALTSASRALVHGPLGESARMPRWRWTISQLHAAVGPLRFRPHGAHGSALSELWTFSRRAWLHRFMSNGCEVLKIVPLGLWYTGEGLLGDRLSIARRAQLARWLGSVTVLYVTRPRSRRTAT